VCGEGEAGLNFWRERMGNAVCGGEDGDGATGGGNCRGWSGDRV
jgi:hypothetical protein